MVSALRAGVRRGHGHFAVGRVSAAGGAYLCHRFVGKEEQRVGSVEGSELALDEYQRSTVERHPKCKKCFARYFCGGGCYHDNLGSSGFTSEPDEATCREIRRSIELAAVVHSQLSDEDKHYLERHALVKTRACALDLF